ncbi:hypothetical protein DPMN_152577 [Dreissena polymorpha]|uniref:Uncharacterized protein n=1 Tax=Dreissena polymorpha TaxID=45954 RepID=A0A9D4FKM9_DREPO|nr:hypothetical protein DPMN_152577 [Dreissena polymorpha]
MPEVKMPEVKNRVDIEQDRTINARVSPGDRPTSDSLNAYTSAGDHARRTPDDARYDTRPPHEARRTPDDVLNFVTHRTADGSDVFSLPDAWRSDTSAGDRIICD